MTKVHILSGGTSSERDVSIRSGAAVADAARQAGYDVSVFDPSRDAFEAMVACDVVFPVLHGLGGEDGSLQALFESHETRYVGSGSLASRLCFDKWQYREAMSKAGLPVARGALVQLDTYEANPLTVKPYILKPLTGGSSIDTYIVRKLNQLNPVSVADSFARYPTMLMEELFVGIELTVGILGMAPLPIIEIIPPLGGEFDFANKYNGKTQELCPPLHVGPALQAAAQSLALQAHTLTGCRDFSRTDMIVGGNGELCLLETNTIPGMTTTSLFPKMAVTAGLAMPELVTQLIATALQR